MTSNFYRPRKKAAAKFKKNIRIIFKIVLGLFLGALLCGAAVFIYFAQDLPDPSKISERNLTESTKIFDRTGQVILYDIHGEEKRTVVPFDQISQVAQDATIAIEDSNFFNHGGLDFKGITRAFIYDLLGKKISQGGSTITQQFIKISLLTSEQTLSRKIKEAVLAIELEQKYSKKEILGFYLNEIPYGSNAYGVEAAAQTFFNKHAQDLDLAESAFLAALIKAPSFYSPYGSHPEELKSRQGLVLDRMAGLNFITKEEAAAAKKEKLNLAPRAQGLKAPHFVMYVKEYLEQKYGADYVQKAGLKVYTTLDWDLQTIAEQIVSEGAQNNWKKYRAYNAAFAAVDPKTGQILALVGSRDYFDLEHDGNVNVALRDRQPGSSFKPFAYAQAFKNGYTPDTILFDLKTEFNPNCPADGLAEKDQYGLDCYNPGDYDDKFRGPVTMRQAIAQSLNIPSVQVLYLAGIADTIKLAKSMGIGTLNQPERYGLSLVLGGGEVKLLDEVAAYGVFANDGIKNEKTAILKIEDAKGNIIERFQSQPEKVLEPQISRMISDVLSDNTARAPIFGANSALYFPDRPVAAKTGTTEGYRDAWTLGYTSSLAAGVWVGNNDNSAMARAGAGIAAAGPLWHDFFQKAYANKTKNCRNKENLPDNYFCPPPEVEEFPRPEPITADKPILNGSYFIEKTYQVNKISGQPADSQTPPDLIEQRTSKEIHNILYYVNKDDPQGAPPADPSQDSQYKNWEAAVVLWASQQGFNFNVPINSGFGQSQNNPPQIQITAPGDNETISQNFVLKVNFSAALGLSQIDFFANDNFLGSISGPPYEINVDLKNLSAGLNILKAKIYDQALNRQENQITVYIVK